MRNKELYGIVNELSDGSYYNLTGVDFVLALVRNVKKMEKEIEVFDSLRKVGDKYKEYLKEVNRLRAVYADLDPTTNKPRIAKTSDGREVYIVTDKIDEFNAELDKLKVVDEFAKVIKEQEHKNKLFEEAIEKECTVKWEKVSKDDLPKELTFKQTYMLEFMINN